MAGAHRAALAAGFTGALHTLGLVLAALSTPGAVLTYLALAPRRRRPAALSARLVRGGEPLSGQPASAVKAGR